MSALKYLCVLAVSLLAAMPAMAGPSSSTIYACVSNATGAVRIVASTSLCVAGETGISWAQTGPPGPAGSGTFFSAQILVTPAMLAYESSYLGSNVIISSPSFNGDPTFGQTVPPAIQWIPMLMPVACTFDSLTVNVNSLYLQGVALDFSDTLTVTLMAQTPTAEITGPSVTLNQLYVFQFTGSATGSMAVLAGSYVCCRSAARR